MTLSFLLYAQGIPALAAEATARGHEIFLHLPMEPMGREDPGPNAILTGLAPAELGRRLVWAFDRVPEAVGVNNHMGSRATGDPATMLPVLQEIGRRGLAFIDSKTTAFSVADRLAAELGLRHAARDVFIDNEQEPAAIRAQLEHAAALAGRPQGAIAIGHPHPSTLQVLRAWLPQARARGIELVTATDLIARQGCGSGTVQVSGGQGGC